MPKKSFEPYEDEDDISYEQEGISAGVVFKIAFLLLLFIIGGFYGWYNYNYKDEIKEKMAKANAGKIEQINGESGSTPKQNSKITPEFSATKRGSSPTPEFNPESELSDEAQEALSGLQDKSTSLVGLSLEKAQDLGGNVMGAATKQLQNTASASAGMVTDTIYQNTVGKVIMQLINTLPEDTRKNVIKDICKETKDCDTK